MEPKVISQEAYDKLAIELKMLNEEKLPAIAEKIEKAKELGDLSENAEYHDAKDEQGMTNARVKEIESILKSAIISKKSTSKDTIDLGSTFIVEDEKGNKKEYTIVSFNEADPITGKISNESPLGEAFMGRKQGDVVSIEIPKGQITYSIKEIK